MAFPPGVETVTVTAGASGYRALDGEPYAGTLRFTPSVSRVVSAEHGVIALGSVNATLGASGDFTAELLAVDADGFSPSGWTYRVDEELTNAPGRAYNISLPAAAPTVALPSLSPVESTTGTVSSPAVLSVNGETGVVTLSAADVGAASSTTQVNAGTGLSGGGTLAADRTLSIAFGTTGATACVGNDSRLSDPRTPVTHAASHGSGGSDPITVAQSQVAGLTVALGEKAALAGATFTGVVTVDDANFVVLGSGKGYRFRPLGDRLDCEATGSDWMFSVFSGTNFDGAQRSYLRLEAGVPLAHAIGKWIFAATADSGAVHTLDAEGDQLGFHGATPVGRQTVTGSRGGNAALADLLTKLATLGLITDGTTV